jgi:hypothetical protein
MIRVVGNQLQVARHRNPGNQGIGVADFRPFSSQIGLNLCGKPDRAEGEWDNFIVLKLITS